METNGRRGTAGAERVLMGRSSPPRLLVAEDDPDMRALVASALRCDGYFVVEAVDGNALLAALAARFDLVITDIRMPGFTGLQVLEVLRRYNASMPIIVMTAFSDDAARLEAERLHATLFDKPFSLADLRVAVTQLLPSA